MGDSVKKLIIATEKYPFGGEKSFLLPELKRLAEHFEILLISHAEGAELLADEELPEGVRTFCIPRPVLTWKDKLGAVWGCLTDADGRREIREILSGGVHRKERIYQSLSFYAQARSDQKALRRSGILQGNQPIIYYSFWYSYFCYSAVREQRRRRNVRIIARAHGVDLYQDRIPGGRQPFRHPMEEGVCRILFACQYAEDYYRKEIAGSEGIREKLQVCRLGVEKAERQMPQGDRKCLELLSCSNVVPLKRLERIIDALSLIENCEIRWRHIGDGEAFADICRYAEKRLGEKEHISYEFLGRMDNREVHQYYRENQADCFITISSTEGGCPVSIQEAMSYGIPVIASAVGGITEMLDGNGILLSDDPTAEETAEAILQLIGLPDQTYAEWKERSRKRWKALFCAEKNTDQVRELLQSVWKEKEYGKEE